MELFSGGKCTDCCEAKLLEFPRGEEGFVGVGMSGVKEDCVPIFTSADLA